MSALRISINSCGNMQRTRNMVLGSILNLKESWKVTASPYACNSMWQGVRIASPDLEEDHKMEG